MSDITVTFTPPAAPGENGQFSFVPNTYTVWVGLNTITLFLSGEGATWATPPLEWQDFPGKSPQTLSPPCMQVSLAGNNLLITDNNSDAPGKYSFVVSVDYDGVTYTSPDPTIVNREITGHGG